VHIPTATVKPRSTHRRQALFLSRLHPKKGIRNLLRAWSNLRPEGWKLLIVGPDEANHREEIAGFIASNGLASAIELHNEADETEKWQHYARSHLFVLPSFSENFGVVIAEALAAGLPVITTKATPWRDLELNRCGWWIDVGEEALTMTLKQALSASQTVLHDMGERGREYVVRTYGWPRVAEHMMRAYEWLVRGGPRPQYVHVG
jgi:glycosyltransferase involved in cell wall biosynthesis